MLRDDAMRLPNHEVFTFLGANGAEEDRLSYGELDACARAIGAMLQSFGAAGERVLLLYPPGLEFTKAFFGCLYAGAIAVPVPPANRRARSLRGLQSILVDASPSLALTTSEGLAFVKRALREMVDTPRLRWLATDIVAPDLREEWWDPGLGREHVAYLQYTSGSTSSPKGVVLKHGAILDNSIQISRALQYDAHSVAVMWLPHFHDNGLVHGMIQPVFQPFRSIMMSPIAFIQSPVRWLDAISTYHATHSGGPNFAYGLCTRRVSPAERERLDLRSWRFAYNAAEPVRKTTMDEFAAAFAPAGFQANSFFPAYGLAEATLLVSIKRPGDDVVVHNVADDSGTARTRAVVGCGPSVPGTRIVIVCPQTLTATPAGQEGEVWIAGPGVAAGYWNRAEETDRSFHAYLADTGDGPFLRTGDLGFLRDNELFVSGRIKDLVIIRGQNHYPQDIECTVEASHAVVRPGGTAAFAVEVDETEGLVLFVELQHRRARRADPVAGREDSHGADVDTVSLGETIRQAIADTHGLHVHALIFLPAGAIPKTSSGKIQRHACRAAFLDGVIDSWGALNGSETPV